MDRYKFDFDMMKDKDGAYIKYEDYASLKEKFHRFVSSMVMQFDDYGCHLADECGDQCICGYDTKMKALRKLLDGLNGLNNA